MYNLSPPKNALNWNLGLLLEVSFVLGLGKPDTNQESWAESKVSDLINRRQIRQWWKSPPKKKTTLDKYINLVTKGETFASEWRYVFDRAIKHNVDSGLSSEEVFGTCEISNAVWLHTKISEMPSLIMPSTVVTHIHRHKWAVLSTLAFVCFLSLSAYYLTKPKYKFGEVFENIRFCHETDFIENTLNACTTDVRNFKDSTPIIYASFSSIKPLSPNVPFKLAWFRNGELQIEKERPWSKTFAKEYRHASTHIITTKFDKLPSEWGDPGRYDVMFYVDGNLLEEARFYVLPD